MNQNKNLSPKLIDNSLILSFLKSLYDFEISEIKRINRGVESGVWLVNSGKRQFFVKAYGLHELPWDRIEDEIQLYDFLNKNQIHTPVIIPNKQNEKLSKLTIKDSTYPVILMQHENLRRVYPESITREEIHTLMQTVAKMHKVLKDFKGKNSNQPGDVMNVYKWSFYEHFLSSPNSKSYDKEDLEKFRIIDQKIIDYLNKNYPPKPELYSIIHSDLALEHVQFLSNGDIYIFDFADRYFCPIAFELAVFLTHCFRESKIDFNHWEKLKTWVLEDYQSITHLPKQDLDSINPFIIRRIQGEIWYMNKIAIDREETTTQKGIERRLELAKYLIK